MATRDEIADLLEDASVGTVGTNIFKGQMPPAPDTCVAIIETPGREPEHHFGSNGIAIEYPRVQIRCRGAQQDYATPAALAQTAYRAMAAVANDVLNGTRYLSIDPLQAPFLIDRDPQNRLIVGFNAQLTKEVSA
jgi:predicted sugar kinase